MAIATLLHTGSLVVSVMNLGVPAAVIHRPPAVIAQVRVYDAAHLPAGLLDDALNTASQLLRTVSVGVTWRQCPAEGPEFCQSTMAEGDRVVRVLDSPGAPVAWDGLPLGSAVMSETDAPSVLATAYSNRIEFRARRCGIEPALLLGRVVAHELRHLLSGESGHPPSGIMREAWTCDELRANRPEDWSFRAADQSAILKGAGVARDTWGALFVARVHGPERDGGQGGTCEIGDEMHPEIRPRDESERRGGNRNSGIERAA